MSTDNQMRLFRNSPHTRSQPRIGRKRRPNSSKRKDLSDSFEMTLLENTSPKPRRSPFKAGRRRASYPVSSHPLPSSPTNQVRCIFPYSQELLKSMTDMINRMAGEQKGKRVDQIEMIITSIDIPDAITNESITEQSNVLFAEESANQSRASAAQSESVTDAGRFNNGSKIHIDEEESSSSSISSVHKEDLPENGDDHAAEVPQAGDELSEEPLPDSLNMSCSSDGESDEAPSGQVDFVVGESYEVRLARRGRPSFSTPADRTCSHCNKIFSTKVALKTHIKKEHSGAVTCSECPRTFSRPADLKKHMSAHSEDRPFPCTGCDRTFKEKRNLVRHSRIHINSTPQYPMTP